MTQRTPMEQAIAEMRAALAPRSAIDALLRIAQRAGFVPDMSYESAVLLQRHMSASAWRMLGRSQAGDVDALVDDTNFDAVQVLAYIRAIDAARWERLPPGWLVSMSIANSRMFLGSVPRLPTSTEDLTFLRVAMRGDEVTEYDYQLVSRWAKVLDVEVTEANQWHALVARAQRWNSKRGEEAATQQLWPFACGVVDWRGYEVVPLQTPRELWLEGEAMSNCLFDLRKHCTSSRPSRFFSVRVGGKRLATLELVLEPPDDAMTGPDRIYGCWSLEDCRQSANRLPPHTLVVAMLAFARQYNLWSQRRRAVVRFPQ